MSDNIQDRTQQRADEPSNEDTSDVAEGVELNPKHRHPPNAEIQGLWKVLTSSTALAVAGLVVVAIFAFAVWG